MSSMLRSILAGVAVVATSVAAATPPVLDVDALPARAAADEPFAIRFAVPRYALSPQERETLAACLVLEAASQGEFGMRAVMAVIRNRAHGKPELFASVVLRPKQFSAFNKLTTGRERLASTLARARRDRMWTTALAVVDDATKDTWHDPTGGATHYTRTGERTPWTRRLATTVTIGAHAFYR